MARVLLLFLLAAVGACSSSESVRPPTDFLSRPAIDPAKIDVEEYEQEAFELINEERRASGRLPMVRNPLLDGIARQHSVVMAQAGFVGHEQPNGTRVGDRIRAVHYVPQAWGENVFGPDAKRAIDHRLLTPEAAAQAWLKSPGHRANYLNKRYTETGMGYHAGYWTQVFARPAPIIEEEPIYED